MSTVSHLLRLPTEIRLDIYRELLVPVDRPIVFHVDYGPAGDQKRLRPGLKAQARGLHPSILRVNKTIHGEATPVLYSENRFRFPDASIAMDDGGTWFSMVPHIAPFLKQIGANAGLLRHICMDFPNSFDPVGRLDVSQLALPGEWADVLRLVQAACPGLRTVVFVSGPNRGVGAFVLWDADLAAKMLRLVHDGVLGEMRSLEKIVLVYWLVELNGVVPDRQALMAMMPSDKWDIKPIQVPLWVWVQLDGRTRFYNTWDWSSLL